MNLAPPQHKYREVAGRFDLLAKRRVIVPAYFAPEIAKRPAGWMRSIFRSISLSLNVGALLLGGCSENPPVPSQPPAPATPAPSRIAAGISVEPPAPPREAEPTVTPEPEPPVDPTGVERRFLSAPNDPAARIAAIRELANATPAAALTLLNRLFPIERREDVKAEMLAALGDLDHTKERDNQLALCTKALASAQPVRIRYIAIHTLVDLHDPRARAILIPLQNDPDREIRAAATQALSDLSQ